MVTDDKDENGHRMRLDIEEISESENTEKGNVGRDDLWNLKFEEHMINIGDKRDGNMDNSSSI